MNLAPRRTILAGAAALLLASGLGITQVWAQTGEQAQVAAEVEALNKAMIAVDRPQLEALTSPALSYGHSAGRIEDKKQFIANLESRANAFRRIELSDQTIATGSSIEPVAPWIFRGSATKRNSYAPALASSSR